ncbi:MAG: hypothetical protein C4305_00055 [Thermoleophilia bacterium]
MRRLLRVVCLDRLLPAVLIGLFHANDDPDSGLRPRSTRLATSPVVPTPTSQEPVRLRWW